MLFDGLRTFLTLGTKMAEKPAFERIGNIFIKMDASTDLLLNVLVNFAILPICLICLLV